MEIDKNKQQKEVTRFMVKPQYGQYLGLIVDENTDVEDEEIVDEELYKSTIRQKIKGTKFITEMRVENNTVDGFKTIEESRVEAEVPVGTRLIWYPGRGYIIPKIEFKTVEEVEEDIKCIKPICGKE